MLEESVTQQVRRRENEARHTHIVEELEEVDVVRLLAEVLLEEKVDGHLEHAPVVDGDISDALDAEPARLPAAGDAGVHNVVCDEEERLELSYGCRAVRAAANRHMSTCVLRVLLHMNMVDATRTSSTHHPRRAAWRYSVSLSELPSMISTVSTTDMPRLSLPAGGGQARRLSAGSRAMKMTDQHRKAAPPGVLYSRLCRAHIAIARGYQLGAQVRSDTGARPR